MTSATIALGIPHAAWVPERVQSLARLQASLKADGPRYWALFTDREPSSAWSQKLFRWALDTGASHLLQLQDDAIVAPNFWPVLRAMIEAQPDRIIGLEAAHPLGPAEYHAGRRWYRTRAWLIGVGYVFPRAQLDHYVDWCTLNPELVAKSNEDALISHWAMQTGRDIWHPVPTIIDHDLGVESTYANDTHHEWSLFRRPTVTWRDVKMDLGALEHPDYWRATLEAAHMLPGPGTALCWFCGEGQGKITSAKTGARLCVQCIANTMGMALGRL